MFKYEDAKDKTVPQEILDKMNIDGHDFSNLVRLSQMNEGQTVGDIVGISYRFPQTMRNPEHFSQIMNQLIEKIELLREIGQSKASYINIMGGLSIQQDVSYLA